MSVRSRIPRAACLAALGTALLIDPTPARADAAEAAQTLTGEGMEHFVADDYTEALDRFQKAYALSPTPATGLYVARSLEKLDRLVDAQNQYSKVVTALPASPADEQAIAEAKTELEALARRVPQLRVEARGAEHAGSTLLTIDGRSAAVGDWVLLDPGQHRIQLRADGHTLKRSILLREGAMEVLKLELRVEPKPERAAHPPPVSPAARTREPTADRGSSPALRTLGWASLGVGAAGLAAGAALGVVTLGRKNELDQSCRDKHCPASEQQYYDDTLRLADLSTVALLAGGALATTGLVIVLGTSPEDDQQTSLSLRISGANATLGGRF